VANIVARVSMLLLSLGLPLAIVLAWYHGNSANRRISGGELSIVSVLLVIGAFLFLHLCAPGRSGCGQTGRYRATGRRCILRGAAGTGHEWDFAGGAALRQSVGATRARNSSPTA
jgi:hypothetical protein